MIFRKLGRTDLQVSELCLGSMQFGWTADKETSFNILNAAYHAGINFFDTADIYSRWVDGNPGGVAEQIIGEWMKAYSIPREKVILATKVRGQMSDDPLDQGLSRGHITKSIEKSLKRLRTEFVDLYQSHWIDDDVPIEETLEAFDSLIKQGKVRAVGCSNYPARSLKQALSAAELIKTTRYDTLQPHYNLVHRQEFETELADVCLEYEVGVLPYSPLAGGFLTGKYKKGEPIPTNTRGENSTRLQAYFTEKNWILLDKMKKIGYASGGYSISQVALAWLRANPLITSLIIGPRNLSQFEDNLGSVNLNLTVEDIEMLNKHSN